MSSVDLLFWISLGMIAVGSLPFLLVGLLYFIEEQVRPALKVLREERSADLAGDLLLDEQQRSSEAGVVAARVEDTAFVEGLVRVDGTEDAMQRGDHPQDLA